MSLETVEYGIKNHISIINSSIFCLNIYLYLFIPIPISTFNHLHIPVQAPLYLCPHIYPFYVYPFFYLPYIHYISIINLSLTFYSPLLFFAYFILSPFLPLLSPFFFHQSSSSHLCSSIFLSKHFNISFLSTFTFSCLPLLVFPTYFS